VTTEDTLALCNGNPDAAAFCAAFLHFSHAWDDLHDRDPKPDPRQTTQALINFILALTGNPWVLEKRAMLVSAMVTGLAAWLSSEQWRDSADPNKQRAVDVLKSQYREVILLCGLLTGGTAHYLDANTRHREYDWETP
jgi:hypothetical protein